CGASGDGSLPVMCSNAASACSAVLTGSGAFSVAPGVFTLRVAIKKPYRWLIGLLCGYGCWGLLGVFRKTQKLAYLLPSYSQRSSEINGLTISRTSSFKD